MYVSLIVFDSRTLTWMDGVSLSSVYDSCFTNLFHNFLLAIRSVNGLARLVLGEENNSLGDNTTRDLFFRGIKCDIGMSVRFSLQGFVVPISIILYLQVLFIHPLLFLSNY